MLNTRLCDKDGNSISALNMRGVLFTEDALKKYALNALKNAGKLQYYIFDNSSTEEDGTEIEGYRGVAVSDIEFKGKNGTVGGLSLHMPVLRLSLRLLRRTVESRW